MNTLKRLFSDERGLETVEYAIIAGLVVVGVITAVASIGSWLEDRYNTLDDTLREEA